jgi:hypothetical protein
MRTNAVLFRHHDWVDGLFEDEHGFYYFDGKMDAKTFRDAVVGIGRDNAPTLLGQLHYLEDALDIDAHPGIVANAWSCAEYPERSVHPDTWVDLFNAVGYTHDGQPAKSPTGPITVYRGCTPERRGGMAWTSDLGVAQRFARNQPGGHVYAFDAPPRALLAYIHEDSEYVIDNAFLKGAVRLIEE